jgi:hypothetical protein
VSGYLVGRSTARVMRQQEDGGTIRELNDLRRQVRIVGRLTAQQQKDADKPSLKRSPPPGIDTTSLLPAGTLPARDSSTDTRYDVLM